MDKGQAAMQQMAYNNNASVFPRGSDVKMETTTNRISVSGGSPRMQETAQNVVYSPHHL